MAVTGWGVVRVVGRESNYIDSGIIRTTVAEAHSSRLWKIGSELKEVVDKVQPELVCIERVFINVNPKSSLLLGEARGVALFALMDGQRTLVELTALQIKQSVVGIGRADKKQVAMMVGRLLNKDVSDLPSDCTDALACALAATAVQKSQMTLPSKRRIRGLRHLRIN